MQLDSTFYFFLERTFFFKKKKLYGKEPASKQIEMDDPLLQSYQKSYPKASCFIQSPFRSSFHG